MEGEFGGGMDPCISIAESFFWHYMMGFVNGSDSKESACSTGNLGSVLVLERSLGEGNGYPLQYSCLENPMDRGTWWAKVHGVANSWTQMSN